MMEFGIAVLSGHLCWVVRDLSYLAPSRGAVLGTMGSDTGLRILGFPIVRGSVLEESLSVLTWKVASREAVVGDNDTTRVLME